MSARRLHRGKGRQPEPASNTLAERVAEASINGLDVAIATASVNDLRARANHRQMGGKGRAPKPGKGAVATSGWIDPARWPEKTGDGKPFRNPTRLRHRTSVKRAKWGGSIPKRDNGMPKAAG